MVDFKNRFFHVGTCSIMTFLLKSFLRDRDGEKRLSRRLPNTSTFIPNDLSQRLYCILPIMWCAFGAHLDVGLVERPTPCRFIETLHVSFPRFKEDGRLLNRRNPSKPTLWALNFYCICVNPTSYRPTPRELGVRGPSIVWMCTLVFGRPQLGQISPLRIPS